MTQPVDLRSDGNVAPALTPGSTVQSTVFAFQASKTEVNNKYPLVESLGYCLSIVFDQAASGGAAVNDDQLPRAIDSIDINGGMLGNTHDKKSMTGPTLAHVWEWIASGYGQTDYARNQIPAADGDNGIKRYGIIPYTSELFARPHHFAPYLGWLIGQTVTFNLAAAAVFDSLSTGAVTKGTCNIRMWANTFVSSRLFIPSVMEMVVFDVPAANTAICQNIGKLQNWNGLQDGARIAALYELHSNNGLGGAITADNITSVKIVDLGIDTVNVDAFAIQLRTLQGGHRGPVSGLGATIVPDIAGNPEGLTATGLSSANEIQANTPTALYTAYRAMGRSAEITKMPKYIGDMGIDHTVTTPYSTGRRRIAGVFVREFLPDMKTSLQARAGASGTLRYATITGKLLRAGQSNGLPMEVIPPG